MNGQPLFGEAKELGYLVKNLADEPYMIAHTAFEMALVYLTNPAPYM